MRTEPPIVLVTGATRGIGRAVVEGLVARGARVLLTSRDPDRARAVASAIGCDGLALDLTAPGDAARIAAEVRSRFGRLDVLINNAGVLLDHYADLLALDPELLRATLETNLIGTFRLTQALVPLLRASSDPRIVNVSSGAGQLEGEPQAWAPAYSISKTALNMLTQQWTAAVPEVAVNSVCPGWCRTEMGGAEAPRSAEEGAAGIVWLALDAPRSARGRFFRDQQEIPW